MLSKEFIHTLIKNDGCSIYKMHARVAQKYYDAEHDIKQYRIFYKNADGQLVEDHIRSNIRIAHPFFTENVDQKVQYMLSNFSITSKDEALNEMLKNYFNDDFKSEFSECLSGASIKGYDYMYSYKNENDCTTFAYADGMGVIEVPAKQSEDGGDYVIYWYSDIYGVEAKPIKRVEVWDKQFRYYYIINENDKIIEDPFVTMQIRPHYMYKKADGKFYTTTEPLSYLPFFRLDNNKKRVSDLKPIKDVIDDYDLMNCGLSNNINDMGEGFIAVKNFDGADMDELYENLHGKKTVGVGKNGDIEIRTVDIPFQARKAKLEEDEKNIYRFGMGFNSAQVGDGNITNIVLKSRYALLDLKCNKMEKRVRKYLKQLIEIVLDEINQRNNTAYTINDVEINLDREIMTNALDNATIEKTEAETEQTKVNTLMNVASQVNNADEVIKAICELLDLDFDKIQEFMNDLPETNISEAEGLLNEQEDHDDIDEVIDEAEDSVGKTLNGAQTQSLISVVSQLQSGVLTESQAINIIAISIGISKDKAREILSIGT